MKRLCHILMLCSSILLVACKKDKITKVENVFVIGHPELGDFTVNNYSPALTVSSSANGGQVSGSIDLFNDGIIDFSIETYGSHWANARSSSIVSVNDQLTILSIQVLDTLWLTGQNLNPQISSDSVVYNGYSGFDSGQTNDSLLNALVDYYPEQFDDGATGFLEDPKYAWTKESILSDYANGYSYGSSNVFLSIQKGNWNNAGVKYLCFKLNIGEEIKYGWLKLRVTEDYSVEILQSAIEN